MGQLAGYDDRFFMGRCLQLARQASGYTAPNPLSGAVIVDESLSQESPCRPL
jgi:pyrimidine deaminase RibD-like protein